MSEYQVITSWNGVTSFQWEVNRAMGQGWKPLGGVCVVPSKHDHDPGLFQAMERQLSEASES